MLTIAGSDCSAGAGLQADLKTGFALGCYPLTVVTCVVSEVPGRVTGIVPMEPAFVADQLALCLRSFPVAAVKCGMLYSPAILRAVAGTLPPDIPLVVDPVMVATSGDSLMLADTLAAYEQMLFPRASLITPNLDELSRLTPLPAPLSVERMGEAARMLSRRVGCSVLAKGGHLDGDACTDILCLHPTGESLCFSHPRISDVSTHGTGCTLSSAITAFLARRFPLRDAVRRALAYTAHAIATSHRWNHTQALCHIPATPANLVPHLPR